MSSILHIFEPTLDFNVINSNSKLLDQWPCDLSGSEYHTSLGDLSAKQILAVADLFDTINFVPDKFDHQSSIYKQTVLLLQSLSHKKSISNFTASTPKTFLSADVSGLAGMWVFGCSYSYGTGLQDFSQRYSEILSKQLSLKLRLVARPGSSIHWSLRHLLHADIKPTDVVIWQITTPERYTAGNDYNDVTEVLLKSSKDRSAVDFHSDPQLFYNHINCLNIGLQYLRTLGVKFAITSLDNNSELNYQCLAEYTKHPEYCYTPDIIIDRGSDNLHWGPKTHKILAEKLYKFLT
jgi:hypothetical protein